MTRRRLAFAAIAVAAALGLLTLAALVNCGLCGEKPNVTTLSGTVKSVDAEARTLVLTTGSGDEAKDVTMKVCPKAKVLVDGKAATLADVKAGAKAQVCHVKAQSGDLVAVRIAVGEAGCPKESQ